MEGERVIITPIRDERLTLEQRLACFDPERYGGDVMSAEKALSAERW
jgi:antitoxin MazE